MQNYRIILLLALLHGKLTLHVIWWKVTTGIEAHKTPGYWLRQKYIIRRFLITCSYVEPD